MYSYFCIFAFLRFCISAVLDEIQKISIIHILGNKIRTVISFIKCLVNNIILFITITSCRTNTRTYFVLNKLY